MLRTVQPISVVLLTMILMADIASARAAALPSGLRARLDQQLPGWKLAAPDADVVTFAAREWGLTASDLVTLRGDFDGNGQTDYAVQIVCGRGGREQRLVAFLRAGQGYRMHTLDRGEPTGQRYLKLARRGTTWTDYATDRKIVLRYDAIQLNVFETSGGSYIYRRGKFYRITTAD